MDNRNSDPRVRKTKRAIRNAFAQLLAEKEFDKITVSDISTVAEINRKTFYCYFDGIYQLVEEVEDEIVGSFESLLMEMDLLDALRRPIEILNRLNSVLNADRDFYSYLLSLSKNVGIIKKINATIKEKAKLSVIEKHIIEDYVADMVLEYAISGMISVYRNWYLSDRRESIEALSEIIETMYSQGISGILEKYSLS